MNYCRNYNIPCECADNTGSCCDNMCVITQSYKLNIHPTEAIVITFNFDKTEPYELSYLVNQIVSKFSNNNVIAIPDSISLESCSKDVLENIISSISMIIENLQN